MSWLIPPAPWAAMSSSSHPGALLLTFDSLFEEASITLAYPLISSDTDESMFLFLSPVSKSALGVGSLCYEAVYCRVKNSLTQC